MSGFRRTRRPARVATAFLAVATLAAAPAVAQTRSQTPPQTTTPTKPTVSVPGACYVYWPSRGSQPIPIAIAGITPGTVVNIELRVGGTTVSGLPSVTVDATGAINTQLSTWTSGLADGPTKATDAKVVVSDILQGKELTEVPLAVANVGLSIDTKRKAAGTKRRWIVSGLDRLGGGTTYYAFYFKHGKIIGSQKIGAATDACGYVRAMRPAVPFKQHGSFGFRVQASPTYRSDLAWIGGTVRQGKSS